MNAVEKVPWAVTPEKVRDVVKRLITVAQPRKIILFGSYVRGQTHVDSDLDVLVVSSNEVANPRAESVRLRDCVEDIDMPMDILVVPEKEFDELCDIPGLIYQEARKQGRVVYEQAN